MNEFERARARSEKRNGEPVLESPRKSMGMNARISVSIASDEGILHFHYQLPGFLGNIISSQRTPKALQDRIARLLQSSFGGQVRAE